MTCSRLLHDQIDAITAHLNKAAAHSQQEDMAFFYLWKAQSVMDEFRREVFMSTRRSGEVCNAELMGGPLAASPLENTVMHGG